MPQNKKIQVYVHIYIYIYIERERERCAHRSITSVPWKTCELSCLFSRLSNSEGSPWHLTDSDVKKNGLDCKRNGWPYRGLEWPRKLGNFVVSTTRVANKNDFLKVRWLKTFDSKEPSNWCPLCGFPTEPPHLWLFSFWARRSSSRPSVSPMTNSHGKGWFHHLDPAKGENLGCSPIWPATIEGWD